MSIKFIGSVEDEWQLFSDHASDYSLGPPIGFGASSIVYAASFIPPSSPPIPCALKVLDLDSLPPHSLSLLQRETTLMSLSKHPNVIRVRGSWMVGHKLYIAMRLMNRGSAADIMRYGWPGGMQEDVVCCILKQALEGLNYLHINDFIHRDVKAANLLIDDDGTVLLGDLGVAADLSDDTDDHQQTSSKSISVDPARRSVNFDPAVVKASTRPKMGKRQSFVGTPCWMAPEVIQSHQYDASADIWSFGITALELTQGRPPRSRDTPQKVLLKTVQDAPPTLDRQSGHYKYSRAFKEIVESCLLKDPSKRPTADQLLSTPFFKSAKKKSYLISTILADLPPLTQRQERRRHPSNIGTGQRTVDSWDFATTVGGGSPTVSIPGQSEGSHAHGKSQLLKSPSIVQDSPTGSVYRVSEDEAEKGVFDVEAECPEQDLGHGKGVKEEPRHSTVISWANTRDGHCEKEIVDTSGPRASCQDHDRKTASAQDRLVHDPSSSSSASASDSGIDSSPPSSVSQSPIGSPPASTSLDRKGNHPGPIPIPTPSHDIMLDTPVLVSSSALPSFTPLHSSKQSSISDPLSSANRPPPSLWRRITSRTQLMSDADKNRDKDKEKETEKVGNGEDETDEKNGGKGMRSRFARKAEAGRNALVKTRSRTIGFMQSKS